MVTVVWAVWLNHWLFHLICRIPPIGMVNVTAKNMCSLFDQLFIAKFRKSLSDYVLGML